MARALVQALCGYVEFGSSLSDEEQLLMNNLHPQRLEFDKNTVVFREGEPANHFLLVEKGICYTHRHLEDGTRQIIDFYFPREVIALGELSKTFHTAGLITQSETIIAAYDKDEITQEFSRSPELSRLFINMISEAQANLTERLVGLTRFSARQRMAHFLLEVDFRQKRADRAEARDFPCKLEPAVLFEKSRQSSGVVKIPQVMIADSLGLSIVHVNRILRQLREENCIATHGHGIELLDIATLRKIAGWATQTPPLSTKETITAFPASALNNG